MPVLAFITCVISSVQGTFFGGWKQLKAEQKQKKCQAIESTRHSYINGLVTLRTIFELIQNGFFSLLNKTLNGTIFETSALVLTSKVVSSKTVQENFELTVVIDASREVSQQETV